MLSIYKLKGDTCVMARSSMKQIEKDEMKIILELQKNARESIDKIADRCNFSRQKVWRIMNKLEEKLQMFPKREFFRYCNNLPNISMGVEKSFGIFEYENIY